MLRNWWYKTYCENNFSIDGDIEPEDCEKSDHWSIDNFENSF